MLGYLSKPVALGELAIVLFTMVNFRAICVFWVCITEAAALAVEENNNARATIVNEYPSGRNLVVKRNHTAEEDHNVPCEVVQSDSQEYKTCESPWQYCDNGSCRCGNQAPNGIIECDVDQNLTVLSCYCLTFDEKYGITELGSCVYNCGNPHDVINEEDQYHSLPNNSSELNEYMCGEKFNRKGTLCGKCKEGYYSRAYSFEMDCIQCPHGRANWWKFLLIAFVPLTVFCLIVLFLKINVTSSHFHGFVMYSQAVYCPALVRLYFLVVSGSPPLKLAVRCVATMYGFWNLDFFRSLPLGICLSTDTMQTLALDLVVGVYPQLMVILSYVLIRLYNKCTPLVILWSPFDKLFSFFQRNWNIRTSLIDAFATFFVLSNFKLFCTSCDLLTPVKVYHLNSFGSMNYSWRVFYDSTMPYFGARHLPYVILALLVLVPFVLLPLLVLTLYPFALFQRFLNLFPFRWYVLHTFVDSFLGCYKDGTEPDTRDCRLFVSIMFSIRYFIMLIGVLTLNAAFFPLATIVITLLLMLLVLFEPFKPNLNHTSIINTISILFLALFYGSLTGIIEGDAKASSLFIPKIMYGLTVIVTILPLFYMSVLSLLWMYTHKRFGIELFRRFCIWRQGYRALE